jgi:hypothetical protein
LPIEQGELTEEMIRMLSVWEHSVFHVFCGNPIQPKEEKAIESLARYIIRASFSQERMQYLDQEGKVVNTSKDGKTSKSFPAMERLVQYHGFGITIRHFSSVGNPDGT